MKRLAIVLAASLLLCGCDTTPTTAEVTSALDEQGPQQVTLPAAEIFGSEWDEWVPLCGTQQAERAGHPEVAQNSVVLRASGEEKVVELNPSGVACAQSTTQGNGGQRRARPRGGAKAAGNWFPNHSPTSPPGICSAAKEVIGQRNAAAPRRPSRVGNSRTD